ncbi:hypothetical protein WA026_005260 [Henosepilachna vigintioctopunctata]|uniref:Uncharacterized protein n=1 Tax=Henosepilachna vigintioctopunctata TaxID=420089 RepID=A0AAW1UTE5_9CUCU
MIKKFRNQVLSEHQEAGIRRERNNDLIFDLDIIPRTEATKTGLRIEKFWKLFENFNFHLPSTESTTPIQPPTPPSTPLSPKSSDLSKYTSGLPNIPNLTITASSQNFSTKSPLHILKKFKTINGEGKTASSSDGCNSSMEFNDGKGENASQGSTRNMFSGYSPSFPYGQIKTENSCSPPFEQSPLNGE